MPPQIECCRDLSVLFYLTQFDITSKWPYLSFYVFKVRLVQLWSERGGKKFALLPGAVTKKEISLRREFFFLLVSLSMDRRWAGAAIPTREYTQNVTETPERDDGVTIQPGEETRNVGTSTALNIIQLWFRCNCVYKVNVVLTIFQSVYKCKIIQGVK